MKKIISLLSAAALLMTVSCGRDKDDSSSEPAPQQPDGDFSLSENVTVNAAIIGYAGKNYLTEKLNSGINGITVKVTNYISDEDDYGTEALNQFNREMLAGDVPDIIIAQPQNMNKLRREGYFTDLYQLMDGSSELKREDILPNILDSLEYEGELPYIMDSFSFETYLAGADALSADCENWTLGEASAAFADSGEIEKFIANGDDLSLWEFFLGKLPQECIDFENFTCDLSGDFSNTLSYLLSVTGTADPTAEYATKDFGETTIMNSRSPLYHVYVPGLNLIAGQAVYGRFSGEDVIYAGYPSSDGQGALGSPGTLFGIMGNAPHKAEAWRVIESFFTLSEQKKMSLNYAAGIPVTESAVYTLAYDTPDYVGNSLRSDVSYTDEPLYITDEAVKKLVEYLHGVTVDLEYSANIEDMFELEMMNVYYGRESAEECAETLSSKLSLYLSENS